MLLVTASRGGETRRVEWFDRRHPALADSRPVGFLSFLFRNERTRRLRSLIPPLDVGTAVTCQLRLDALAPTHAALVQEDGAVVLLPISGEVVLRGQSLRGQAPLAVGERFQLGDWAVTLGETAGLDAAGIAEVRAARAPEARQVLADELEQRGAQTEASWLRLEPGAAAGGDVRPLRERLRAAAAQLAPSWRARYASGRVLHCDRADCPGAWDKLDPTAEPRLRSCGACRATVAYADSPGELLGFAVHRRPAVLDAAQDPGAPAPFPLHVVG